MLQGLSMLSLDAVYSASPSDFRRYGRLAGVGQLEHDRLPLMGRRITEFKSNCKYCSVRVDFAVFK